MMRWLAVGLLLAGSMVGAQPEPMLTVTFDREGVPMPHWELRLQADGTGEFESKRADAPVANVRAIHVPSTGWQKMQRLLAASNHLAPCETKAKNLARIGVKTVVWRAGDGNVARCSFNYTDNKPLSELAEMWSGMAATLNEGPRIAHLHRYDRLGLDKELADYEHAVQMKMAIEPALIEPELRALVEDESVMERVRERAARLLKQ